MTSIPSSTSDAQLNPDKSKMNTKKHHVRRRTREVPSRHRTGLTTSGTESQSKSASSLNVQDSTVGASLSELNNGARPKTIRRATSLKTLRGRLPAKTPAKTNSSTTAKTKSGQSGSSKLHSTVLAEKTVISSKSDLYSTTLVGGLGHGGKKLGASKETDVSSPALPELPDISAIRLNSVNSDKIEDTMLSATSDEDSSNGQGDSMKEITLVDLKKEYLRYLQAAYLDSIADEIFEKQVNDLKTQVLSLEDLTNQKQRIVNERKRKLLLLRLRQTAHKCYEEQKELLNKLADGLPENEITLGVLTRELEKHLHQIKMNNLHIPENQETYLGELSAAQEKQTDLLEELRCLMEPRNSRLSATASLFDDLQDNCQRIQQCKNECEKAAGLAIQEASLLLTDKQTKYDKGNLPMN